MPFSISKFKTVINQYGGPARSNLFEIEFFGPNSQHMSKQDLMMFCRTASIPSLNLSTIEYRPDGFGRPQSIPTTVTNETIDCVFMLDSNHKVMSFFHEWMQRVVNYSTTGGIFSEVDGMLPYEFGYKKDYQMDMVIRHYSSDNIGEKFYEVNLRGVFPTQIGAVNLSWDENDSYSTMPVNFSYSSIGFSGERTGIPTERFSRGTGFLDFINFIGTRGQVINQSILPTSVQDAINQFTRVRNSINTLRDVFR